MPRLPLQSIGVKLSFGVAGLSGFLEIHGTKKLGFPTILLDNPCVVASKFRKVCCMLQVWQIWESFTPFHYHGNRSNNIWWGYGGRTNWNGYADMKNMGSDIRALVDWRISWLISSAQKLQYQSATCFFTIFSTKPVGMPAFFHVSHRWTG